MAEARVSGRALNEGEHLEFWAHIREWKMEAKRSRCNKLLTKSDCNLRTELLEQKEVLLIPQERYPEYTPLDETPGWWYVPTEAILGRVCKKCNAFRVLSEFTSKGSGRKNKASCRKCKSEGSHVGRQSGVKRARTSESQGQMRDRGRGDQEHQCSVQRTLRKRPPVKYTNDMRSDEQRQ